MKKSGFFSGDVHKGIGVATLQLDAIANMYQPIEMTLPLAQCAYGNGTIYFKVTPKFVGEVTSNYLPVIMNTVICNLCYHRAMLQ